MVNFNLSDNIHMEDQKYEIILEMRYLTRKGMASKVVEEISSIDPDFFQQNPILLFQLKQVSPTVNLYLSAALIGIDTYLIYLSISG